MTDAVFWIVALVMAGLVVAGLARAMMRAAGATGEPAGTADIQVYRDQLAEIERDAARGALSTAEADNIRLEVKRRLLEADRAAQAAARPARAMSHRSRVIGAGVLALAVLGGTGALYLKLGAPRYPDLPLAERLAAAEEMRRTRPSQAEIEAEAVPARSPEEADPRHLELMEQLRAKLAERPNDLEGLRLLARNEAMLGNYTAAHQAQTRVLALEGPEATAQGYADLADLMALAAGGYISPEAEQALAEALRRDPQNELARYYTGLMFAQNDRPDRAFQFWRALVEGDDPTSLPAQAARRNIELAAELAGIQYDLPRAPGMPGPSAEDMANAAEMSAGDRQEMIQGMVNRLMDRLANEGGSAEEWARLINALGVLGDTDRAKAIWGEAQTRFAGREAELAQIRDAALSAGVAE